MICASCKAENPNSNWYCLNCGASLRDPAVKAPPADSARKTSPAGTGRRKTAPKKPAVKPEKIFAGRYRELVKIGDGAMASVYRALDTVLDQTVALKVLHPDLAANHDYIARFKREIALARTITHPNVYRIYDIGQSEDSHFISMEYVEGEELKSIIQSRPPGLEEGLRIIRQICLALSQAHRKGIIHRDLKPQNIMLEKETGRCVVMDFGIAIGETSSAITQSGAFLGTPEYISPEQANGQNVGQAADIYAVGIIMYELFTGKLPFGPGKPLSVALKHINETPVAPRKLKPELPRELEAIILKAMEKEPARRYQSAAELAAELGRLSGGMEYSEALAAFAAERGPGLQLSSQNPYLNRNMIRDRRFFYGRKKEIATIYSRIGAGRPQSVSIVGERRIGKSSLLHFINESGNRLSYLKESASYIFIFMDFQEKRRSSAQEFFVSLFEKLKEETAERIGSLPEPGYDGFKEVCERLDGEKMKLVLLFDEFESITKNRNFTPEFFAFLRSLANNYNVAYVTSSVKNLQELCHNREISDSPFFNIFSNLNLGAFTEQEARLFVGEPSRIAGNPLEEHFDSVVELAGYFPFYMAIACSILFDFDFEQVHPRKTVFENIEELFLDEAGMHFQFILDSLSRDEIRFCKKIIDQEPLGDVDRYAARSLIRRGYLLAGETDQELRLFSGTFAKKLLEHLLKEKIT